MEKLIRVGLAGAMLLSMAAPVLAYPHRHRAEDVDVAIVNNSATAISDTGGNTQDNYATAFDNSEAEVEVEGGSGDRLIDTGDAHAKALAVVVANTDVECGGGRPDPCECRKSVKDIAVVKDNSADAEALTGANYQDDVATAENHSEAEVEVEGGSGDRTIYTGDTWSKAKAFVVVNTDIEVGGRRHRR